MPYKTIENLFSLDKETLYGSSYPDDWETEHSDFVYCTEEQVKRRCDALNKDLVDSLIKSKQKEITQLKKENALLREKQATFNSLNESQRELCEEFSPTIVEAKIDAIDRRINLIEYNITQLIGRSDLTAERYRYYPVVAEILND